jgi:hypothetical protein
MEKFRSGDVSYVTDKYGTNSYICVTFNFGFTVPVPNGETPNFSRVSARKNARYFTGHMGK